MGCFGTTDFDNNSRLITLSAIILSGLHCITNTSFTFARIVQTFCETNVKTKHRRSLCCFLHRMCYAQIVSLPNQIMCSFCFLETTRIDSPEHLCWPPPCQRVT